ncbi:MAG: histone deacetylase [Acidobacteriaceae bacterium]|nr:histone deacetylase [Acidobacteriaceae bacterium]
MIELAHDSGYVRDFLAGTLPAAVIRRIGFPWSEGLVRRTLASVGGTLQATQDAFTRGWGGNLAGGTHHAFRGEGSGFCVFNDIAIAIEWLRSKGRVRRAAILDLDVHQGDGTAQIFQNEPNVLTISVHCKSNFPFRKQRSTLDVELAEGVGDEEYLRVLDQTLPVLTAFEPEITFYQSGVDGLASDTLGKLALTYEGLKERDRRVAAALKSHGIPMVATLGGGYSTPIDHTVRAHANTFLSVDEIFRTAEEIKTA